MKRILIAEDEPRIASFLQKGLKANGFATTVVEDGVSAAAMARDEHFDIMVLDLGLPGMDGRQVLTAIRSRGERLPVIVLTARQGDTVASLDAGADDYVTKPFKFDELLARVRARLRDPGSKEANTLQQGDVVLDMRSRRVSVAGKPVELSAREFILAETLMRHAGQVLSREQLLSSVWGYDFDPGSNVVDVYVGYLRKKLGPSLIETVRGMGYRMVAQERSTA